MQATGEWCNPVSINILIMHNYFDPFPACPMMRLKGCPDGSVSTAWDYAGLLCNLYWDASEKTLPPFPNLSCPIPTQPLLHMMLTGLHHSPVVNIPLLLPSNSSILLDRLLKRVVLAWLFDLFRALNREVDTIFNSILFIFQTHIKSKVFRNAVLGSVLLRRI